MQTITESTPILPGWVRKQLPAMVLRQVEGLPVQRQAEFIEEFRRRSKSRGVGHLLCLTYGLQYLYMRKWGTMLLFWVTLGGALLWWFVDLFRFPGVVRNYNKDVALSILKDMRAIQ